MPALSVDYTGSTILINDTEGNLLSSTIITSCEKETLRIEVEEMPEALVNGASCRLLILSSPAPYEYQGRVLREGSRMSIALFRGQEMENRGNMRYKINSPALIEHLVCNGQAYPLHTPLKVELMNISKSGVRFSTPYYAMTNGDRFQMRMKISDSEKLLIADVNNCLDNGTESSEYGCLFLIGSEKAV